MYSIKQGHVWSSFYLSWFSLILLHISLPLINFFIVCTSLYLIILSTILRISLSLIILSTIFHISLPLFILFTFCKYLYISSFSLHFARFFTFHHSSRNYGHHLIPRCSLYHFADRPTLHIYLFTFSHASLYFAHLFISHLPL